MLKAELERKKEKVIQLAELWNHNTAWDDDVSDIDRYQISVAKALNALNKAKVVTFGDMAETFHEGIWMCLILHVRLDRVQMERVTGIISEYHFNRCNIGRKSRILSQLAYHVAIDSAEYLELREKYVVALNDTEKINPTDLLKLMEEGATIWRREPSQLGIHTDVENAIAVVVGERYRD